MIILSIEIIIFISYNFSTINFFLQIENKRLKCLSSQTIIDTSRLNEEHNFHNCWTYTLKSKKINNFYKKFICSLVLTICELQWEKKHHRRTHNIILRLNNLIPIISMKLHVVKIILKEMATYWEIIKL